MTKSKLIGTWIFVLASMNLMGIGLANARLRNAKIGDKMPLFSLPDLQGKMFSYKHNTYRAFLVVFLSFEHQKTTQVIADLEKIKSEFRPQAKNVTVLGITTTEKEKGKFEKLRKEGKLHFPILCDAQYQLWGKLGVNATPTILVIGKDDTIQWVRAGYAYDFITSVRTQLASALGLTNEEKASLVQSLSNATPKARAKRHIQMARLLAQKGQIETAIKEAQKAAELTPDSIEVLKELGQFLCRAGKNQAAIEIAQKIKSEKKQEQALACLIHGWALRQMGEGTKAEQLLHEATQKDPKSARAFYELGKIYQARNQTEKAMLSYQHALAITFDESPSPNLKKNLHK